MGKDEKDIKDARVCYDVLGVAVEGLCLDTFSVKVGAQGGGATPLQYYSGKFFRKDGLAWKPCGLRRSRWSRHPWDFLAIAPLKGRSKE